MAIMTDEAARIAEKIGRCLTERDDFDDGEVRIAFNELRSGVLRRVFVRARVDGDDDLDGNYEIDIVVRRRSS